MAQQSTTDSAVTSPATPLVTKCSTVQECWAAIDVLTQRLDKVLDAYEKASKSLSFSQAENEARKTLDGLKNELLAAKDQYIKDILADNDFLRKQVHPSKSALRKFFDGVEKVLIFVAGVLVKRGL